MCWIVKNQAFKKIPTILRERRSPYCEARLAANIAQQPMPGSSTSDRFLEPGEKVQIDIKVFSDNNKARKHKRAMWGVYMCAITVVDLATGFKLEYALKHTDHLETTLEEIRLKIYSKK